MNQRGVVTSGESVSGDVVSVPVGVDTTSAFDGRKEPEPVPPQATTVGAEIDDQPDSSVGNTPSPRRGTGRPYREKE